MKVWKRCICLLLSKLTFQIKLISHPSLCFVCEYFSSNIPPHPQVKYVLHLIDLRHENQWANKTIYLLYTELIIGAVKVYGGYHRGRLGHLQNRILKLFNQHKFYFSFFNSMSYSGADVRSVCDNNDQSPHLPTLCHTPHVSFSQVNTVLISS